ncbi:MAG: hypothetical protein WKF82_02580 [Nocardioidaceae bacterium]
MSRSVRLTGDLALGVTLAGHLKEPIDRGRVANNRRGGWYVLRRRLRQLSRQHEPPLARPPDHSHRRAVARPSEVLGQLRRWALVEQLDAILRDQRLTVGEGHQRQHRLALLHCDRLGQPEVESRICATGVVVRAGRASRGAWLLLEREQHPDPRPVVVDDEAQ